jgi:hypothetical protein
LTSPRVPSKAWSEGLEPTAPTALSTLCRSKPGPQQTGSGAGASAGTWRNRDATGASTRSRCSSCSPFLTLRDILLPSVAGRVIAYALNPLVDRIERLGLGRLLASVLVVLVLLVVFIVVVFLPPILLRQAEQLLHSIPDEVERLRPIFDEWARERLGQRYEMISEMLDQSFANLGANWTSRCDLRHGAGPRRRCPFPARRRAQGRAPPGCLDHCAFCIQLSVLIRRRPRCRRDRRTDPLRLAPAPGKPDLRGQRHGRAWPRPRQGGMTGRAATHDDGAPVTPMHGACWSEMNG